MQSQSLAIETSGLTKQFGKHRVTTKSVLLVVDDSHDVLDADDWQVSPCPPFEGIRLIGHRWDPKTYHLRDLLVRNQVRYQWLDIDRSEEAYQLLAAHGQGT